MQAKIRKTYMDSLFRRLFDGEESKENLLSLYNAMNGTNYTDLDALECMTIEDVIFMGMKNDVAFLVDCQLNLYEHQGSYNPNMPLRGMLYCSQLYQKYLAMKDIKLYGKQLVKIPTPRYVVFYNGIDEQEDIVKLRLSEAFEIVDNSGDFEWTATMVNINFGHNQGLMESCKQLQEYAIFIDKIRTYKEEEYSLEEAAKLAVNECIDQGILVKFLNAHKAEVLNMILTEYDEQEARDWLRKEGREEGIGLGIEKGLDIAKKIIRMRAQGKTAAEIATECDISESTVAEILAE